MSDKATSKKRASKAVTANKGYTPFPIQLLALEIQNSRSSLVLALCSVLHVNDILHQSGLITDDCWNKVKGTVNTVTSLDIVDHVGSTVSTLVEAGTGGMAEMGQAQAAQMGSAAKILAAGS